MSNAAMTAVFLGSQAKGTARLVLLAMADEASTDGHLTAYGRSYTHLGRKANIDASNVRRAIRTLVDLGELQVLSTGHGRASSDYRLVLPGLPDQGGHSDQSDGSPRPPRGVTVTTPSSPSTPSTPSRSARATADAAVASLPGIDPQPGDDPVGKVADARGTEAAVPPEPPEGQGVAPTEEQTKLAWTLVREAFARRRRKPLERRDTAAKTVARLLAAGWDRAQIQQALMGSPAWTPTALQIELTRVGAGRPLRAGARSVPPVDDPRRQGESRVVDVAAEVRRARGT